MKKLLKDKHGEINPGFIKGVMVAVCALVLGFVGVSAFMDERSEREYLEWAREENRKVFDDSQQIRMNEKQLLKLRRELNDSFYQRLEHDLPVRILVVGDAYGNGFGARSKSAVWSKLLQTGLSKKYGVKVEVENITLSGMNGGYGAWTQVMKLPDGTAGAVLSDVGAVKDRQGAYTGEVLGGAEDMKDSANGRFGDGVDAKDKEGDRTGKSVDMKTEEIADTGKSMDSKTEEGAYPVENMNTKTVAASRENEYDLCIVSLGMTDEPQMFELYYEGVLREVRRKFSKCSIISLLSNQALTAPELGYADDNYDALYRISKHYDAAVLNVGLEMTDPDAAEKGATMSQIPFGAATAESLAADMRADGISEKKVREVASKDLEERSAAAEAAIRKYTIDGLYLNNEGQKFLSDRLLRLIDKKVSKGTGYDDKEIAPIKKEVVTLDQYHYFPVSELVRLDEFTYVLAENRVKAAADSGDKVSGAGDSGAGSIGVGGAGAGGVHGKVLKPGELGSIVGVDYDLVPGDNDVYAAVGDGTEGFGRIVRSHSDTAKEHYIYPLNEGYSCERDGNLILGFSTKAQADTLHGVILGGDFTLPSYFGGYQQVPYIGLTDEEGNPVALNKDGRPAGEDSLDNESESTEADETTEATKAETTAAKTTAAETTAAKTSTAATSVAETTAAKTTTAGTTVAENTAAKTTTAGTTVAENTAAKTTTTTTAVAETTAAGTTAENAATETAAAETTAATFGNDQSAQGNATAVAESFQNLSESLQAVESLRNLSAAQQASESLNNLSEAQQAMESSEALYEFYAETYPEAEVVIIHDGSEGANFGSGTAYTAENNSSDYPTGVPGDQTG